MTTKEIREFADKLSDFAKELPFNHFTRNIAENLAIELHYLARIIEANRN